MDVWVLLNGLDPEEIDALLAVPGGSQLIGVFSSRENALAFLRDYLDAWEGPKVFDKLQWRPEGDSFDAYIPGTANAEYPRFMIERERIDPPLLQFPAPRPGFRPHGRKRIPPKG